MVKLGVDYSLTSPAITIQFPDNTYEFISFFDTHNMNWQQSKSKQFHYHNQLKNIIKLIPFNRTIDKTDYRHEQQSKMKSANELSNLIISTITDELMARGICLSETNPLVVGLEGFSFNSKSSSTIDLVLYQTFFRSQLLNTFPYIELNIISPSEGKKVLSGKGNAKKDDMIRAFVENRLNDNILTTTCLWQYIVSVFDKIDYKNIKPLDDIVDSYAILKSI